jgi:hypothetical protein
MTDLLISITFSVSNLYTKNSHIIKIVRKMLKKIRYLLYYTHYT